MMIFCNVTRVSQRILRGSTRTPTTIPHHSPGTGIQSRLRAGGWRSYYRLPYGGGGGHRYQRFQATTGFLYRWAARPTFYRDVGLLAAATGGFYVWNLEEVPISGRRRFNIVGPDFEAFVAEQSLEEIKEQYKGQFLAAWDPRVRKVQEVLDRLIPFAEKAGLTGVEWEVHVIESPEQNAFVIPGGKVFVFTGILELCRGADDIAAILGHEIAHVVAHHTAETISRAPLVLIGALALTMFDVSFTMGRLMLDLFLSWPGSRKQEAEADYIGLMMMAQGCYRPIAAAQFWERMEKYGGAAPPQILSTHPSNHNRQDKILEWLPKAQELQDQSDCQFTASQANQFTRIMSDFRLI